MAELAFRVRADYEELLQLNNELQRNRAEMLACNTATDEGRQKMAALEKEYGRISDSIKTIVEKAAQVAIDMKSTSKTIEDSYVSLMANVKKANEVIGSSFKETNKQFDDARKGIEGTKDAISKSIDILTAKIAVLSRQRTLYDAKGDNKRVEQINEEITATEALIQRQKESLASIGERGNTLSERAESIRNIIVFYDQLMEKISSAKDLSDEQINAYNEQIETMRGVILSEFENLKKEVSPVTDMLADAQKELSSLRSNPDIIKDFEDIRQKLSAIRLELSSADPNNTQHIEELENEYDNLARKLGEVITLAKEYEKSNVISVDLSDYISQVGNAELATKEFLKSVGYQADFLHSALAVTKNDITSQVENIKKEISDLEVIKASHESNGETAQALLTQQDIDRRKEYIQLMENSLSLIDKENAKTIELAQSKELAETGTSVHNKVDIEEVSRVRREMSSLREEMLNVDSSTDEGKQKVAELNARYADLSKTLSSLVGKEKEVSIGSTLSETGDGVQSLANAVSDGDAKMSEMLTTISEKHTKAVEEIAKAKEDITRVIDNLNTEIFSLEAEKKTVKTTSEKESIDAEIESIRARIAENERLREAINSVETAQEERIQVVERSMDIFDAFADKQLSAEHATEATVAESQDGINRMLENTRAKIDSFNEAVEKIPGITDSIKSQEDSFKIRMEIKDNFTEARERLQSLRVEMFSVDTSTEEGKKKLVDLQAQYADWLNKFKDTLSQAVAQQDAGVIDVPFAARIKDSGDVELALNQIFELAKGESSAIVSVFEGAKEQLNEMADSVSAEINELYGKQRELRQQGKYSEADAMDADITQKVDERNSIFDSQKRIDDELSRYRAVAGEIEEIKEKISTKTEIDIDFDDFNEARAYISDIRKEMNELDLSTEEGKKRFRELNHELLAASDYLRQTAGGAALTMSQGDSEYGLGDSMVRFMNESAKVNGEIDTMLKDIRENYQETVDSISVSIDTIDSKLEELDANLVRLQRERAVSESAGDTKAVERYDTEIAQLETQISNQQKLRSILEEKAAAAQADYNAFMTSVGMLDEFAADQKEAVQTTETTISSSTSELEKMIETARKHYTNLNQDIKDSREVVSEIGQVNGISLGNTSVLKDFTEAKGKLADLRDQMMAVDTTTSVGQAQLRALTKEYDSWLIRLRQAIDLSKQYAQSGAEREDITRFIEQAGAAEEAVNKIYSAAKNESDALAKSIADAKAKVEKQISDLNAELDSLKKERNINISSGDGEGAERLNNQIAEKEAELAASQAQMDALEEQDKKRKEVIETIQEQIDAYEGLSDAAQVSMLSGDEDEKVGYLRDANDQIGELTKSYKELAEAEEEENEAKDEGGKKTKNLTEFTGAYNTIIRMLPAPLRSVVGGMRSLSKASLQFIKTPLGATLLALSLAFKGVSLWLNNTNSGILAKAKWTQKISDLTEKWSDKLGIVSKKMKEVGDATASGAAEQITAYRNLQRQWEQANGVLEKQKEVLASDEWSKLDMSISGVNDAENVLVTNSANVVKALIARARAAALYKKIQDQVEEQIKREDTYNADNKEKEEEKEEYKQTEKEQTRRIDVFRKAAQEAGGEKQGSYDIDRNDWYYVDSEGNKHYKNGLSDGAWEQALLRNNRALRLAHGQSRKDVSVLSRIGDSGLLPAKESYELLAKKYSEEVELTRGRIENIDNQIKANDDKLETEFQKIVADIDERNELQTMADTIISDLGVDGSKKQQQSSDEQERKRTRERKRQVEDVEMATRQAQISIMKDGTEKTIAQINLDKEKEKIALQRAYEDLREEKIDQARKLFESDPKNKNLTFDYDYNSSEYAPTAAEAKKYLAEKNAVEYESARKTEDALFQEQEAMYAYLKEYGNYWEKRLATINHYNGLIERATTEGERKRLAEEKEETINALERERVAFRAQSGIVEEQIAAIDAETKAEQTRLIKDMENIVGAIESSTQGLVDAKANLGQMMNNMFNGNVDLTNRPQIPSIALADAGWDVDLTNKIARIAKFEEISTGVTIDTANAEGAISVIKEELSKTENFKLLSSEEIDKITELILALARLKDQEVSLSVNTDEADKEIASLRNRVISIPVIGELDEAELSRLVSLVSSVPILQEMSIETDTTQIDNTIDEIKDKFSSIPGINALSDEALATLVQYLALLGTIKNEQAAISNDSIATVYSMDYEVEDASGETHSILVTPILQDGTVLTPDALSEYIDNTINGAENLLSADNLGIIIGVDVNPGDGEFLHKMQELFYSSEPIEYDLDTNFIGRVEWALPDIDPNALARPYLDAQKLIENGWKDENDNLVFSSSVEVTDKDNKTHKIVVTPVLSNGEVLTKEELDNYISNVISGAEDIKAADSMGIVLGVDVNDDELNILQKLQTVYYSDNGNDKEKLAVLKEEILLLAERYRLTVLQNDLKKAETEKQFAENGTRAEQIAALRNTIDAQAALIKDTKHREIFKASGDVKIAQETYGNWQDYDTYDKAVEAAQKVYEAKKAELELREDNLGLMNLEMQHANDMFNIELKFNKDLSSIFGNVSRYTKEQLANARNLASSILKAGKYTDSKGNTTALTQTNIKELQEAINQIDDAEFNKRFEWGSDSVIDLAKNMSYLGDLKNRLAEAKASGADDKNIKDIQDKIKQQQESIRKGFIATGVSAFVSSLRQGAEYMKQIAEAAGDTHMVEMAEQLGAFAQNIGAAAEGAATGGWIGAIVGGVSDIISQTVNAFVEAEVLSYQMARNAEMFANALQLKNLSVVAKDFESIFGQDKSALMSEYGKKATESARAYREEMTKLENTEHNYQQGVMRSLGGLIFTGLPFFGFQETVASNENLAYMDAKEKGYNELQAMSIKTKDYSGWANFWGKQDEYTSLKDLAPQLWDENGEFNIENAKEFLSINQQLSDEQRRQLEQVVEINEKYKEAEDGLKSMLSSMFGNTASTLADATIEGLHNGATRGAEDMKRILGGTAKELQKSMVESIYARYMQKYQDKAFDLLMDGGGEEDLLGLYNEMLTSMGPTIQMAQNAARRMEEMGEAMGFDMSGLQNATPSQASYQTISETTGTAIDGRLTSLQISSGEQTGLLGMMNMSMSQMLEQVNNGTRIADDVRNILTDSYLELVEIRKNTGDNVSELKLVKQMVATIEQNTRRL